MTIRYYWLLFHLLRLAVVQGTTTSSSSSSNHHHLHHHHPEKNKMSQQLAPLKGSTVNVAMLTSGGLAPCLSASIAELVKAWLTVYQAGDITGLTFRFYRSGYKGLLTGDSFFLAVDDTNKATTLATQIEALNSLGGSPIGNSRVKVCFVLFYSQWWWPMTDFVVTLFSLDDRSCFWIDCHFIFLRFLIFFLSCISLVFLFFLCLFVCLFFHVSI